MKVSNPPTAQPLAIFDLDNTLLAGDSDYLWGQYLVDRGIVDKDSYEAENKRFYEDYKSGDLDIHAFLRFSLTPLTQHAPEQLASWREEFVNDWIMPIVALQTPRLLEAHRNAGHELIIITATNSFITTPIANALGIKNLLATEPEIVNGTYTGAIAGIPCFQEGKIQRLQLWLQESSRAPRQSWFYSDSNNDLPLLLEVEYPVAVDPDPQLESTARSHGWPVVSLRGENFPGQLTDSL